MRFICVRTSQMDVMRELLREPWEFEDNDPWLDDIPKPHPLAWRECVGWGSKFKSHFVWVVDLDIEGLLDLAAESKLIIHKPDLWRAPVLEIYDACRE